MTAAEKRDQEIFDARINTLSYFCAFMENMPAPVGTEGGEVFSDRDQEIWLHAQSQLHEAALLFLGTGAFEKSPPKLADRAKEIGGYWAYVMLGESEDD